MPNSELLLDTNAAIALLNGDHALAQRFSGTSRMLLSVVVFAELLYGAQKSSRPAQNLARVDDLCGKMQLLTCDRGTAQACAMVRNQLRIKGKPIPVNDLWIAATAIQHGLILVTRDSHFDHIDGIQTSAW